VSSAQVCIVGYSITGFMSQLLMVVLFAGARLCAMVPLRGLTSENGTTSCWARSGDYFWHLGCHHAPVIGSFAASLPHQKSFIEEIKQAIVRRHGKGLRPNAVLIARVPKTRCCSSVRIPAACRQSWSQDARW